MTEIRSERASETTAEVQPPEARPKASWRPLNLLMLAAWVLRVFIVAPFNIPSDSMLSRLYIGDYLIVAKWPYGYDRFSFPFGIPSFDGRLFPAVPERGDVVVFRGPAGEDVIKRVIGLPGDQVATHRGGLVLNGKAVPRKPLGDFAMPISANSPCRVVPPAMPRIGAGNTCLYPAFRETLPGGRNYVVLDQIDNPMVDDFAPVKVPAGALFVMGDNRDDSADSRYTVAMGGMGFVPQDHLIGRALVTFWSTDGSAVWYKPWTWLSALRPHRIGEGY